MSREVLSESEHLSALWQADGLLDLRLVCGRTKEVYIETRAATLSIRFFATFGRLVKREADKEREEHEKPLAKLFWCSEAERITNHCYRAWSQQHHSLPQYLSESPETLLELLISLTHITIQHIMFSDDEPMCVVRHGNKPIRLAHWRYRKTN